METSRREEILLSDSPTRFERFALLFPGKSFDLFFSSEPDCEIVDDKSFIYWHQVRVGQSTKEKDRLLQAYLITRPICIILPLYKAIIFIAYNYISITSDIDIKIHIQSMLISLQIKEIVNRPVFEKSG
jgi:hypothetical protein